MQDATNDPSNQNESETDTYLVFTLPNGLYATGLLGVREVVEFKEPKTLPNTNPAFLGVINIRGEIIGVVDLSARLGGTTVKSQRPSLLVVDTDNGAIAVLVNDVQSVVSIEPSKIDTTSASNSRGDSILGVAQVEDKLVTIVNLKNIIECTNIAS